MKGSPKVIANLNKLLISEFSAVHQYLAHHEMNLNNGYTKLAAYIKERAGDEQKHADMLMKRIVFLEGKPAVESVEKVNVALDVPRQFDNDLASEMDAVKNYREAIDLCLEEKDHATRSILETILTDEEEHVDEIEAKKVQISNMTLPLFLTTEK